MHCIRNKGRLMTPLQLMRETSLFDVDCLVSRSFQVKFTLQGWQGVQTIPRVVTYDAGLNELVFYPIEEVEQLHSEELYMGQVALDQVSWSFWPMRLASCMPAALM